ncbi:MAG TPA: TlpA disulfide reductase family protein [Bacteroidia bacterium]|jgi:peroxiredoxin|nr:TlpA disulfide reductase family protein [Bacteroidia bacterium]
MRKRLIFAGFGVILAFVVFYFYNKYKMVPSIDIQKLEIITEAGQPFNINDLKGKKLIISFYASWCGNCLEEMQDINKIKNTDLKDIEVVCITDEPLEKLTAFKEAKGYPFRFLKLKKQFPEIGINSIPVTYIVNQKMEVVKEVLGYIQWNDPSTLNHIKSLY